MDACNDTEKERERCDGNVCNEMERGSFEPINNDNMRNVLAKSHSKPAEPVCGRRNSGGCGGYSIGQFRGS